MHLPDKVDPAELLRRQLAQIESESIVRQEEADRENEARLAALDKSAQIALDGLARTSEEIKNLPKMEKDDPEHRPPRLSDINPFS